MPNNGSVGTHWLDYVKQAAIQAIMTQKPCNYVIGTVVSAKPLKIKLSEGDGLELPADFIHLLRNVTDYETQVTIGGGTKQTMKIHNALKKGDKVMMIRKWGGQDFIVIDRVVS